MALVTGLFASPAFRRKFGDQGPQTDDIQVSYVCPVSTKSINSDGTFADATALMLLDLVYMASPIAIR